MSEFEERYRKRLKRLVLSSCLVAKEDLAVESDLMLVKWPDYKFLNPWDATVLFGRTYQVEFKDAIRRHCDYRLADRVKGIDIPGLRYNQRELTSLWRARQQADNLGIRYREYIHFCIDFAMNRKRTTIPRPNQLFFSEKSKEAWISMLSEFWTQRLFENIARIDPLEQYHFGSYRGLPAQDAYRNFIVERTMDARRSWSDDIRVYSIQRREVPIRMFARKMDKAHFDQVFKSLRAHDRSSPFERAPDPGLRDYQLWQSCFGVPHAQKSGNAACGSCPQRRACKSMAEAVLAAVVAEKGSADPVREKALEANRARVQRHREKKRLMARSGAGL